MLVNAVKKGFVNPVVCAVEDFVGAITNQITNTINSALDSVLSPIRIRLKKILDMFQKMILNHI